MLFWPALSAMFDEYSHDSRKKTVDPLNPCGGAALDFYRGKHGAGRWQL
jgi:hypothetical protein